MGGGEKKHPSSRKISNAKARRRYYAALAEAAAKKHGLNVKVFRAQIMQESGFNPKARSRAGAQGICQIMPSTARAWGVNPWHPKEALNVAAKNMAAYVRTYRKQGHDYWTAHKLALASYNAGAGAVAKYKRVPPYHETQHYVKTILAEARK